MHMKYVAIPVTNNRLSEYFGECDHYEIYALTQSYQQKIVPAPAVC